MPTDESQKDRTQRLGALLFETQASRFAPSLEGAIALALQGVQSGNIALPLAHAIRLNVPLPKILEVCGLGHHLVGSVNDITEVEWRAALDVAGIQAAMLVLSPDADPVISLPMAIWQARQAGRFVIVVVKDPQQAFGLADLHPDLLVSEIEGIGMIAGRSVICDHLDKSVFSALMAFPQSMLCQAEVWLEGRLVRAEDIGQIAGTDLQPGPFDAYRLKSHKNATLTEAGTFTL